MKAVRRRLEMKNPMPNQTPNQMNYTGIWPRHSKEKRQSNRGLQVHVYLRYILFSTIFTGKKQLVSKISNTEAFKVRELNLLHRRLQTNQRGSPSPSAPACHTYSKCLLKQTILQIPPEHCSKEPSNLLPNALPFHTYSTKNQS